MIGKRLKECRKAAGLYQEDIADLIGVSVSAVKKYEQGTNDPDDEAKVKIAKRLNVSLDYLLGAIDDEIALIRDDVIDLPIGFSEERIPALKELVSIVHHYDNTKSDKK